MASSAALGAGAGPGVDPWEVVDRLEWFFLGPEMTGALGEFFISERAQALDLEALEQPLSNFETFRAYSQLLEELLEDYLHENGLGEEALFASLQAVREVDGQEGNFYTCIDYVLAAADYEAFLLLAADWVALDAGADAGDDGAGGGAGAETPE